MFKKITSLFVLLFLSVTAFATTAPSINKQQILAHNPDLKPDVLSHAINGYQWAMEHGHVNNPNVLTIVDFTKPSYEERMWVIDLKNGKQLMKLRTTHASNSGMTYATKFSNSPGSHKSSLGVFQITNAYQGKHGLSARMQGLESGVNNNAYRRTIVIHPATYATAGYARRNHRLGRSWGCFAVDPAKSKKLVNLTKNGSVLFAYAKPEERDPVVA